MTDTPQIDRACDHALGLLSEGEEREFLATLDDANSPTDFELAAAELELAVLGLGGEGTPGLPAELEKRLGAAATAYAWALDSQAANHRGAHAPREPQEHRVEPAFDWVRYLGWAAAAAALVVVGVVLSREPEPVPVGTAPSAVPSLEPVDAAPPSLAEKRAELLHARDARTLPWSATKDEAAKGASGDVVWSTSAQQGYMRFKGLAPNDPKQSQYQLWIFAEGQDERYPVDGGVFDVDSSGEVVVAIDPKLHVEQPTLFAVTVEKPGGVVVSKRERIVLTAAGG